MSKILIDSDSDIESNSFDANNFNLNSDYAKSYDIWRRKEELQKLKDKYGNDYELLKDKYGNNLDIIGESDDYSDDDDDDDGDTDDESETEEIDGNVFDNEFFKVYSALKSKNPKIYDENVRLFNNDAIIKDKVSNESDSKSAKMSINEYHRKLIKEKKGITDEDYEEINWSKVKDNEKSYYEELSDIKSQFRSVLNDNEEDDDTLIKTKTKLSENTNVGFDLFKSDDSDLSYLKNYWENERLDDNEKYLRDYVLNKRYIDAKEHSNFKQFSDNLSDSEPNDWKDNDKDNDDSNNKEKTLNITKFHFEEPESTIIKRFPRNANSMRDVVSDATRSVKRSEVKQRKKIEKESELKRLRKLKREELREKINKLKEISGNKKLNIKDFDLNILVDDESDFNAGKYDEKMNFLFGDEYYDVDSRDVKKPKFQFTEGIDDEDNEQQNYHLKESSTFNDDTSKDETFNNASKNMRKKKMKDLGKLIENMEIYEDIIGNDLPTRFRYRVVNPNDFGLTDEEILFSDDKELNKWCSMKKICQYRTNDEERYDIKSYRTKGNLMGLKRKIFKSLYDDSSKFKSETVMNSNDKNETKMKRKKKRRSKKPIFKITDINSKEDVIDSREIQNSHSANHKKRKRIRNKNQISTENDTISMERLKAYGLSNREIKRRKLK